jgi:rfaE bifunctional protein nucleotidyltransferase chain/domain
MLAADGNDVNLVTALADDDDAGSLRECLAGVTVIAGSSGAPTPVKTRIRVGGQSVVRIDEGCAQSSSPTVTDAMLDAIAEASVIVVADYGRGLTAEPRLRHALERRAAHVPLVWDPHPKGAAPVPGTMVATPNLREAAGSTGTALDIASAAHAAAVLQERWGSASVVVTLGAQGALLHRPAGPDGHVHAPLIVPAPAVSATDTCGAGDRLSATLAVRLAGGTPLADAVEAAVEDAAAFLAAGGVGALENPRPPRQLSGSASALTVVREVRAARGTVVATGGCFDLLHAGHVRTLSAARAMGDCLIVCLNSDSSVRRLKGQERPIMGQQDRVDLLMALACVDAVMVFDEETPEAALQRLRPDIWVKGGDYTVADLPEADLMKTWGGDVVTVPFHPGRSTTRLAAALAAVG